MSGRGGSLVQQVSNFFVCEFCYWVFGCYNVLQASEKGLRGRPQDKKHPRICLHTKNKEIITVTLGQRMNMTFKNITLCYNPINCVYQKLFMYCSKTQILLTGWSVPAGALSASDSEAGRSSSCWFCLTSSTQGICSPSQTEAMNSSSILMAIKSKQPLFLS